MSREVHTMSRWYVSQGMLFSEKFPLLNLIFVNQYNGIRILEDSFSCLDMHICQVTESIFEGLTVFEVLSNPKNV